MKFLVDENLSERVAEVLVENGHDAIHVREIGLERAGDPVVMDRAEAEGRVVVAADTDFGAILARSGKRAPSVILLRTVLQRRAWSQAALILANLPQVADDLEGGAIVTRTAGCGAGGSRSSQSERPLSRGSPAGRAETAGHAGHPRSPKTTPDQPVRGVGADGAQPRCAFSRQRPPVRNQYRPRYMCRSGPHRGRFGSETGPERHLSGRRGGGVGCRRPATTVGPVLYVREGA